MVLVVAKSNGYIVAYRDRFGVSRLPVGGAASSGIAPPTRIFIELSTASRWAIGADSKRQHFKSAKTGATVVLNFYGTNPSIAGCHLV